MLTLLAVLVALLGSGAAATALARAGLRREVGHRVESARERARGLAAEAQVAARQLLRDAELTAEETALAVGREQTAVLQRAAEALSRREEQALRKESALARRDEAAAGKQAALTEREGAVAEAETEVQARRGGVTLLVQEAQTELERIAGESADEVRRQLVEAAIEQARSAGAAMVRAVEASGQDPDYVRSAKRMVGIVVQRYHGHYLSERMLTVVPLPPGLPERLFAKGDSPGARVLRAIEQVTATELLLSDAGDCVRLDGADAVGREVARRVLARLCKEPRDVERDPVAFVQGVVAALDREILDLGRKAFADLGLARPHPEIMALVGRLHFRTSYTQNQWKHSVEAAFLAGMMAAELRLDPRLARRATLLHDIGKALSHDVEGSHALLGAELARRYGEDQVVVNCIAAHHAEVPCESAYADLVVAADAASGGRPGARRELIETYVKRIVDLERISSGFPGVQRTYAVQAGREVRVFVDETRVSDATAATLSQQIAERISNELTFPGQIKVTVIRELRAVALAS